MKPKLERRAVSCAKNGCFHRELVVEKNEKSSHNSHARLCPHFQLYLPQCGFFTAYTGRFGFLSEGVVSAFYTPYNEVEKLGKNDYLSGV